jgi:hypothetical protein
MKESGPRPPQIPENVDKEVVASEVARSQEFLRAATEHLKIADAQTKELEDNVARGLAKTESMRERVRKEFAHVPEELTAKMELIDGLESQAKAALEKHRESAARHRKAYEELVAANQALLETWRKMLS